MGHKRKPAAKKPAAGSGCGGFGCLLTLLLFPIIIPLAVLLWLASVFTGGIVKAAFTPPNRGD